MTDPHKSNGSARIFVAQVGARRHYAIPSILARTGHLERFFTDIFIREQTIGTRALNILASFTGSARLSHLLARSSCSVPPERVATAPFLGLCYAWRRWRARDLEELGRAYRWMDEAFGRRAGRMGFGRATGVYAFQFEAAEIFRRAKEKGLLTILDQCNVPLSIQKRILEEERARWPGWEDSSERRIKVEDIEREEEEWSLADAILAPSAFVQKALEERKVPPWKCHLVPFGLASEGCKRQRRAKTPDGRLRILFLGSLSLRKGLPYFLEALKRIRGLPIRARAVGSIQVSRRVLEPYKGLCEFPGFVPRNEVRNYIADSDILVLPSLFEGSPSAVFEALAAGLPVITTENAGTVVRDGAEGFIVPARDYRAISSRIEMLCRKRTLLEEMSRNALARSKEFSFDAYVRRLTGTIERLHEERYGKSKL